MPSRCPYFIDERIGGSCAPRGITDVRRWRREGVAAAVAALEEWEMTELGYPLQRYVGDARGMGIEVLHVPIKDMHAPAPAEFLSILQWIEAASKRGRVVVHCNAGVGRSPTILIGYLVRRGLPLREAFEAVRSVNQDVSLTYWQEAALMELENAVRLNREG